MYAGTQPARAIVANTTRTRTLIAESKLLVDSRLRTAVADNSLELVFQPQYDLRLGQVMGAEALLRWADQAEGGLMSSRPSPPRKPWIR
jgi:sensor c-di-GMP phosphodiesterase-like protein